MLELAVAVIVVLIVAAGAYWHFRKRKPVEFAEAEIETDERLINNNPTRYIPVDTGRRTNSCRVFMTNKGLRSYYVNSDGLPLPNK